MGMCRPFGSAAGHGWDGVLEAVACRDGFIPAGDMGVLALQCLACRDCPEPEQDWGDEAFGQGGLVAGEPGSFAERVIEDAELHGGGFGGLGAFFVASLGKAEFRQDEGADHGWAEIVERQAYPLQAVGAGDWVAGDQGRAIECGVDIAGDGGNFVEAEIAMFHDRDAAEWVEGEVFGAFHLQRLERVGDAFFLTSHACGADEIALRCAHQDQVTHWLLPPLR